MSAGGTAGNANVDREVQILARQLDERAARGGEAGFKDEAAAVKFMKGEARSLGWQVPGEEVAASGEGGSMVRTTMPVALPMRGAQEEGKGREPEDGNPAGRAAEPQGSHIPGQEAPGDPWSEMLELQEAQRKRGEELRSQGEFSDHSNEENEQNYRDEERLKQLELDEFGREHGMTPQQVKTLQDDIDKATKHWEDGWFSSADRARILSDGRIVVNPHLLLSPEKYIDAVVKSGGSAEAKRRALSELRGLRARASQQLYDAVIVLEPVKEFLDKQPGDVTHKIAALLEEQQRHPIWNKLSGQLGAGADDVAAAGVGLLAMASGQVARVEKLFGKGPVEAATRSLEQLAGHLTQRGAAIDQLSGLSKTDGLIDFTGHVVRMAPDLMAMEATGGLVRGGLQVARYGKVVEAGSEAARALNAAGQTAGAGYFGARSGAATYLEALQAGLNAGKSLEEARADALAPAVATGVLSYATFSTGGTKGLTNIFRSEAATRALLEGGFKAFARDVDVSMVVGGMQMGLDSLAHDIVALRSYHPELTGEESLERALKSVLSGAAFAGFTRAVHGAAIEWRSGALEVESEVASSAMLDGRLGLRKSVEVSSRSGTENKETAGTPIGRNSGASTPLLGPHEDEPEPYRTASQSAGENIVQPERVRSATFGRSESTDYRATFFAAHPELKGKVWVHHAVPQNVLKRYPSVVSDSEMHSLENLRGIPNEINRDVHQSKLRMEWNKFYREHPTATKEQLLKMASYLDAKHGSQFRPPL